MTTSSTLILSMAHDQVESTMATLTTDLSRNQPHGLAWALGCLAQHRDGQVWSLLVAQVGPDIQRLAVCLIGDFALAEDAVQETLLLVRDHAGRFTVRSGNGDDDARRWILGVAANASRQIVRRHGRQLQRDRDAGRMAAQVALPIVDPSQRAENVDQSMLLRRELAELPDVYGQVLTLHYFGGQDYSMLATDLQVSIHTVRSRVHRGLKALRERLDRCGVTLSIAALTGLLSHLGAASTVGGAATVSATTLGLISSTAVPTTSFSAASSGMTMATVLTSVFAALFAVVVLSGVYLSSFGAESTPPQKVEVMEAVRGAGTAGAAEVVNNARVTPFILVVKTDQMKEKTASAEIQRLRDLWPDSPHVEGPFLTSGPDQFRLPLHLFAHYDFNIKWGDGTTQVVRSDAPADQASTDDAWLAQVTKGLEQSLTLDFDHIPLDEYLTIRINEKESRIVKGLRYLLKKAGVDLCGQIFIDPKVSFNELDEVRGLRVKAMKLGDIFERLGEVTGLTYVLHDRALVITEDSNLPSFKCPQHTYAQPGTYTIEITENVRGGFPQIYFNSYYESSTGPTNNLSKGFNNNEGYDCVKVMDLAQWGGNTWMNMHGAFSGCINMTISASDAATALTGEVKDFKKAWFGCRSLTSFSPLNTAAVTELSEAWKGCAGLTSFPLLNTAAVTELSEAWKGCAGLTSFPLLNTSAGTNFRMAWSDCLGLTSFPLLDTSAGTDFSSAWFRCFGLTSFPLLNTSAGTNFSTAWSYCGSLTSFPLLDTSAGTDFSTAWSYCRSLTSFPLLDTSAGTSFKHTWLACSGLTSFPMLDTSAGTNFDSAWASCSGLTSFPLLDISAGTNFNFTWGGSSGLTSFPLLDTSAGTNFRMAWRECVGLTSFPLLNTSAGTNFSWAWMGCSRLTIFPLLDTSSGTDFSVAWSGCSGLTSFPLLSTSAGTRFLDAWSNCSALASYPLLDTSAGTDFRGAWSDCSGLTSFPLLDTSAGTNFSWAWRRCSGLTSFPLLNTSAGTEFVSAWSDCSGLTSFPLLNTSAGKNFGEEWTAGAWSGCTGLKSFPLLNFTNMEEAKKCFSGVTLTSASYGELLANIAALNRVSNVEFDGGLSKTQSLIGIQAREKLTKKMGWTIVDGDNPNPKPPLKKAQPAEIQPQPQPEEANSF